MASFRVFPGCRVLMAAASAKSSSATAAAAAAAAVAGKTKVSSRGIMKPAAISPVMQKFVGVEEISRADAVKKVWEHIKTKGLQNPADKREIFCDEKLKSIFGGKDKVGMMEIAKLLSPHFVKANKSS